MKKLILVIIMLLGVISMAEANAQLPHCCKKKVRIKKQSKRAKGALVGVKGKDDNKSLRKREKERARAFKNAEKEKRLAEKNKEKVKDSVVEVKIDKPEESKSDDERVDELLKIFDQEQKNLEDD